MFPIFLLKVLVLVPGVDNSVILDAAEAFILGNGDKSFENILIIHPPDLDWNSSSAPLVQSKLWNLGIPIQVLSAPYEELLDYYTSHADDKLLSLTLIIMLQLDPMGWQFMASYEPGQLHASTWLVPNEVPKHIQSRLRLDSNVFQMVAQNVPGLFDIQEIYQVGGQPVSLDFANYSMSEARMERHNNDFIWLRRADLMGFTFRVGYKENRPAIYEEDGTMKGIMMEIINILAAQCHFDFILVDSVDGKFGTKDPDGTWTGNIGMLINESIDFSITDLSVTSERSEVVSFSTGILIVANKLFMKIPRKALAWTTFVDVFDNNFWITVGLAFVMSTLALYILFLFVQRETTIGFNTSLAISFLALLALSVPTYPRQVPGRILFLSVLVMGSLVFWSYNAGLVSLLTIEVVNLPIKSLEDLVQKTDYQLMVESATSYEDYFKTATKEINPTAATLWEQSLKNNPQALLKSISDVEEKLLANDKLIYFGSELPTILTTASYPCHIVASDKSYFTVSIAWAFQNQSQFLPLFNHMLNSLKQTGHLDRILNTLIDERPERPCKSEFQPIQFHTIFTAFMMLSTGISLAVLTSLVELWNQRSSSRLMILGGLTNIGSKH